jgi:hypothetical protein
MGNSTSLRLRAPDMPPADGGGVAAVQRAGIGMAAAGRGGERGRGRDAGAELGKVTMGDRSSGGRWSRIFHPKPQIEVDDKLAFHLEATSDALYTTTGERDQGLDAADSHTIDDQLCQQARSWDQKASSASSGGPAATFRAGRGARRAIPARSRIRPPPHRPPGQPRAGR